MNAYLFLCWQIRCDSLKENMFVAWIFLFLAITTEVAGTLMMNESGHSGDWRAYGVMYLFISSSYFCLSFALRKISVGIAIAIWEGLGTALITAIAILFLEEAVSVQRLCGIAMAMGGIALLHFGEDK